LSFNGKNACLLHSLTNDIIILKYLFVSSIVKTAYKQYILLVYILSSKFNLKNGYRNLKMVLFCNLIIRFFLIINYDFQLIFTDF